MRRLFFAFPNGWPGVALLLLRVVFGIAVIVQGRAYLSESGPPPGAWFMGLSDLAVGALLVIGCLTPIAGALVAAAAGCVGLSFLPECAHGVFDSKTSFIFGLTMLVTILGVGPGAFSVDARVFGRREIIIPTGIPQDKSL